MYHNLEVVSLHTASEQRNFGGQEIEQAGTLTRFAVEARYPGEIEPITPEEVAQATELAERSATWAPVQIYEVSGPR
jgi:hypothetical protein